ncbi:MAG: hypothetical protein EOP86_27490 [Verrucomicrobiaceae bacterium]|nr:MAG: hypothetical protein EOP86_27490 [Verrucomicrobiaceae bacterium]
MPAIQIAAPLNFMEPKELAEHWQKLIAARAHLPIPAQSDFHHNPAGDAELAWRIFGGLSLEEAYEEFLEDPMMRQEDFMWMYPNAFGYYCPVVDRYLRTADIHDAEKRQEEDCEAWILGRVIEHQFHWEDGSRPPDYVVREIRSLSRFVHGHLSHYSEDPAERNRIDDSWRRLDETLSLQSVS